MASSFTANQQQQQHQQQHHHHHQQQQQQQQHHHHQQQQLHQQQPQQQHHHHPQQQHHHHHQQQHQPQQQHHPQQHLQHQQQHHHHHQQQIHQHQQQQHQHQLQQHQQQQHQQQQQQQQQQPYQPQTTHLLGKELKMIASTFVKQYYTLLNKAPCFIHNFYNQDSTFIHGTIELGTDHHNEPVVGRERIEKKMKELKLNDCRAKIKQIDCLETLAGGLVIQVIGELSNNGRPMRRFLQTFVLAPSPDQSRSQEGDQHGQGRDTRRGVQISENSSNSSHNQKFYVLNSIFRYQDDGADSEFEDDSVSVQANTNLDSANGPINDINNDNHNIKAKPSAPTHHQQQQQQQLQQHQQQQQQQIHQVAQPQTVNAPVPAVVSKQQIATETGPIETKRGDEAIQTTKRGGANVGGSTSTAPPNGTVLAEKKADAPEKVVVDNGKPTISETQAQTKQPPSGDAGPATAAPAAPTQGVPAPKPSNEPKTWANMVRNALPPSSTLQPSIVPPSKDQQPSPTQAPASQVHQQSSQPNPQNQPQNDNSQNNNNRRPRTIRKPANKPGSGRTMKSRNPRPQPAAAGAAPAAPVGGKPPA